TALTAQDSIDTQDRNAARPARWRPGDGLRRLRPYLRHHLRRALMPHFLNLLGRAAGDPLAVLRMRVLPPFWILALVATLALLGGDPAEAGIADTPLPTFSTLRPALLVAFIPGVLSRNSVETFIVCTNVGLAPVDMGVELFDATGTRANTIAN